MQRRAFLQNSLGASSLTLSSGYRVRGAHPVSQAPEVTNAGVGDHNGVDSTARIEAGCLAQRPELPILMAGTNGVTRKNYAPLADSERNGQLMVSNLMAVKSQVMPMPLLTVHKPYLMIRHDPAFYKPEGHAVRKATLNAVIQKLASANNLPLPDMHYIVEAVRGQSKLLKKRIVCFGDSSAKGNNKSQNYPAYLKYQVTA